MAGSMRRCSVKSLVDLKTLTKCLADNGPAKLADTVIKNNRYICRRQYHWRRSTKGHKNLKFLEGNLGWMSLIGIGGGTIVGVGYSFPLLKEYFSKKENEKIQPSLSEDNFLLEKMPDVPPTTIVKFAENPLDVKLRLFQYATCPFCCKVRAFLDYHSISYEVVEVNAVLRKENKWSKWKQVPTLVAEHNGNVIQLNESSMIISALLSLLHDKEFDLSTVYSSYPIIDSTNSRGKPCKDIMNKYHVMYGENTPASYDKTKAISEAKWRAWADDHFVHVISPNIYQTMTQSLGSFQWFSKAGGWEMWATWERYLAIYVGAIAMYFLGKVLKKRHNLDEDVRISLYRDCETWMSEVSSHGIFRGGSSPDLADLAVYGMMSAMEGCEAFTDALNHTNIGTWYYNMKDVVKSNIPHVTTDMREELGTQMLL